MSERAEAWAAEVLGDGPDLEGIVEASRVRDRVVMHSARSYIAGKVRDFNRQAM